MVSYEKCSHPKLGGSKMSFQTILFVFGAILFLVGLIGHVKAKEIEVGSTSKTVRVLSFILGTVFQN